MHWQLALAGSDSDEGACATGASGSARRTPRARARLSVLARCRLNERKRPLLLARCAGRWQWRRPQRARSRCVRKRSPRAARTRAPISPSPVPSKRAQAPSVACQMCRTLFAAAAGVQQARREALPHRAPRAACTPRARSRRTPRAYARLAARAHWRLNESKRPIACQMCRPTLVAVATVAMSA